ncbi:MAG: cobalamin biosynthesis protein, partial [Rhodoferax sp.]|nr:cobalamin biosynthesis protein [Rhodoferax sp.]
AMALNLDVPLRKPGVYVLNADGRRAGATDTASALVYASKALLALVLIAQVAMILVVIGGAG